MFVLLSEGVSIEESKKFEIRKTKFKKAAHPLPDGRGSPGLLTGI
jgi:hypothetical protein